MTPQAPSLGDIVLRLVVATILGAIVGIERERSDHAAGLRTHALVALGAALFMLVSAWGFDAALRQYVVLDPSRVAAQVASGIGFLGAGTIILRREIVRGLTTAASIWAVAAIGLASGAGMFLPAAVASILVLVVLAAMRPLEAVLIRRRRRIRIELTYAAGTFSEESVRDIIVAAGATLERIDVRFDNEKARDRVMLVVRQPPGDGVGAILRSLRELSGLRELAAGQEKVQTNH